MRRLVALAAVALVAGCGSGTDPVGGPTTAPAQPVVQSVDQAPPEQVRQQLSLLFDGPPSGTNLSTATDEFCASSGGTTSCTPPSAAELARLRVLGAEHERLLRESIRPAPDSPPRVRATLELPGGADVLFTLWRATSGDACWLVTARRPDFGSEIGPAGPCVSRLAAAAPPRCTSLCVDSLDTSGGGTPPDYVLAGAVPQAASELRITRADGSIVALPLEGPPIAGTALRVVVAELGTQDWRRLETLTGGAVTGSAALPESRAKLEDCEAKVGPLPHAQMEGGHDAFRAYSVKLNDCLRAP